MAAVGRGNLPGESYPISLKGTWETGSTRIKPAAEWRIFCEARKLIS
jgi:hypothetical protein